MQPFQENKVLTDHDLFLKDLRAATAENHKRLEETQLSKMIVSPQLTKATYEAYLKRMYSFVLPFEQHVFPVLKSAFPDIENRRKASLLLKDLVTLNSDQDVEFFKFNDLEQSYAVGCMYVLEGSILGGKFIARNINAVLGYTNDNGASYFSGYGADTGKMWGIFVNDLCNYGVNAPDKELIFKGADDTFKNIHKILSA